MAQTNLAKNWAMHPFGLNYVGVESDGSIRLDPTEYESRETWSVLYPIVFAGQRIIVRAKIKTGAVPLGYVPPAPWSNGARIGVDFRDAPPPTGNIIGGANANVPPFENANPWNNYENKFWVDWDKDWTLRQIDVIAPSGSVNVIMWFQAMAHDAPASVWMKDMEMYILDPDEAAPPLGGVTPPSGCFIATACGTSNAHLSTLRRFRNRYLPLPLVHAYYRGSPPLADRIRPHENVKTVFRKVIEWLTCQLKRNLTL